MFTKNKYHILIIPSWYPSFKGDINGSFFREQALALTQYGHKVGVITPQVESLRKLKKFISEPHGLYFEIDECIPTYRWSYLNITPRMHQFNIKKWVDKGLKLCELYIAENGIPDIIHVHSLINAGYLALKIKEKYGVPFVVTEHSTAYARGLVKLDDILKLKNIVDSSSKNIAVSNQFKNLLDNIFDLTSWIYIPNIVNQKFLNQKIIIKSNHFKYINICFLDEKKRVDNLIFAFARVLEQYPDLLLEIGGDGPEKANLEELVTKLGINKNIKFLGQLTRDEVKNKMNESSAFVLSSEYETFGVVVVEALALGKPVIATKCGGPESIIIPEVGLLVEKNSIDELATAMLRMYETVDNYDEVLIKKYCEENFSERAIINSLTVVYSEVLGILES